jgi:hypothetical protein
LKEEPPFNPLDKLNLGIAVRDALLKRPVASLQAMAIKWAPAIFSWGQPGPPSPTSAFNGIRALVNILYGPFPDDTRLLSDFRSIPATDYARFRPPITEKSDHA